jgi:hypothetical protein
LALDAAGAAGAAAIPPCITRFADVGQAQALIGSEKINPLVADFDRVWGDRVVRRREILEIVQELDPRTGTPI